jgi:hypothetical protein
VETVETVETVKTVIKEYDKIIMLLNDLLLEKQKLQRDDVIEYCFKNYFSFLWLLKSDQNVRNVPKDVFSEKDDILAQSIIDVNRKLMVSLRSTYMVKVNNHFNELIQQDIIKYDDYVTQTCTTYVRKKEIDKQTMLHGSLEMINPVEFLEFFERYA